MSLHQQIPIGNALYLVDFDGTLTFRDSFVGFLRFAVPMWKRIVWFPYSLVVTIAFFARILDNGKAKEVLLRPFFGNTRSDVFNATMRSFGTSMWMNRSIRPELLEHLQNAKGDGHRVVVVTASLEGWVGAWCDQHGFECIGSMHEVADGVVTGRLASKNCYGAEKVARIKKYTDISEYSYVEAWGNSSGDKEMLEVAHAAYYKGKRLRQ